MSLLSAVCQLCGRGVGDGAAADLAYMTRAAERRLPAVWLLNCISRQQEETRAVWQTVLCMNSRDGFFSVAGLCDRMRIGPTANAQLLHACYFLHGFPSPEGPQWCTETCGSGVGNGCEEFVVGKISEAVLSGSVKECAVHARGGGAKKVTDTNRKKVKRPQGPAPPLPPTPAYRKFANAQRKRRR